MRSVLLFAALLAAAPSASAERAAPLDATGFSRLATLAGVWRIDGKPDSPLRIRFELTAGGSVLLESWEREGRPHSLTVYHRDDGALIATHYCPQGNQPRLAHEPPPPSGAVTAPVLDFAFRGVADLDPGEAHLHDLRFELSDPARIIRSEVYRGSSGDEKSRLVLVRAEGRT